MTIDELFKEQLEKAIPLTEELIKELQSYKPDEGINTWKFGGPVVGSKPLYFMNKTGSKDTTSWKELDLLENQLETKGDFPEVMLTLHVISSDNIYKLKEYESNASLNNNIPIFENIQF